MKKYLFNLFLFSAPFLIFQTTFAFSYSEFFNKYAGNITGNLVGVNNLINSVNFGNIFKVSSTNNQNPGILKINNFGNSSLSETIDKYTEQSQDRIGLIYSRDSSSRGNGTLDKIAQMISGNDQTSDSSVNGQSNIQTETQKAEEKKKIFVSCADSLYGGNVMTEECKQFPSSDYQTYIEAKNNQLNSTSSQAPVSTSLGQVTPSPASSNGGGYGGNTVQSDSINSNRTPLTPKEQYDQRNLVEPAAPSNFDISKTNTDATAVFDGWITGWATLFAIKGGANEAGQKMNKTTAFGYNPYDPNTCIASLPYKTIDKFFGTTLDQCIKSRNTKCIGEIKKKVKDRAIEVIMLKNGKRGVFPLGDLGPAEWTGNAIDFTRCAGNIIGATGKDMVRFRPAPQGTSLTK